MVSQAVRPKKRPCSQGPWAVKIIVSSHRIQLSLAMQTRKRQSSGQACLLRMKRRNWWWLLRMSAEHAQILHPRLQPICRVKRLRCCLPQKLWLAGCVPDRGLWTASSLLGTNGPPFCSCTPAGQHHLIRRELEEDSSRRALMSRRRLAAVDSATKQ